MLDTAEEIITEDSWEILTPEDIYVLTSSIFLHDCAMHLNKAALWNLITSDIYNGVLVGFSMEDEWSARWDKFTSDVKKFDESDYIKFFGEDKSVELPEIGSTSMTDEQKVIIGDFVRQYHACIAQVISTHGMPSKSGPHQLFDKEFKYLNELSGLIARSHNHSLRTVVDLLKGRSREHRKTHPTYLMGVLRVADYLQFQSDRTPKILFDTMSFCSPISISEWKKHLAVISTNDAHADEELLFVEAFPDDAKTLVGIKNLLAGLQRELDEFWAVNGEIYSRYPKLQKLSIMFRRVKSNIDNEFDYVQENYKQYHPEILSIKADDQKLFPLLIKPLYGDHPKVGLRELLQNSLDASNERFCLESSSQPNDKEVPLSISIELNFDNNTLTIKDHGIGMDVDVIKGYFLKIGSSYRTSESWKSKFTQEGNSQVPRTGKFGIGMLAGFLIGHKIDVQTKRFDSSARAVSFSYQLDSNEIELSYRESKDVGTTIIIHSNKESLTTLKHGFTYSIHNYIQRRNSDSSWWYYLDSPKVLVTVTEDNTSTSMAQRDTIPKKDLFEKWHRVDGSTLEGMYWDNVGDYGKVFCNGILIQGLQAPNIELHSGLDYTQLHNVNICVFDNKGDFPLNLTRNGLVTKDFFEVDKLGHSVKSDFINKLKAIVEGYKFSKENILSIINKSPLPYSPFTNFPLVFTKGNIIPLACDELFNQKKLIFVDFILNTQKRGIIYERDLTEALGDMLYSSVINVDKQATEVEQAICNFVLNRTYKRYANDFVNNDLTHQNLDGWLFVKNYDIKKIFARDTCKNTKNSTNENQNQ